MRVAPAQKPYDGFELEGYARNLAMSVDAIDVGAVLDVRGEEYRVTNLYIDEDGTPHLTISHGTHNEKLTYEDVREGMEEGWIERVNSGHEAWQWRTNQ